MILLLGGTTEGRQLALALAQRGVPLIYSIAGTVRQPDLPVPVPVLSGGFRPFGGLHAYLQSHQIRVVVDATHPYAVKISQTAQQATSCLELPYLRLQRPAWSSQEGDDWLGFERRHDLFAALTGYRRVFLTLGAVSALELGQLRHAELVLLRRAVKIAPATEQDNVLPLQAIGPFLLQSELALMRSSRIEVLVTKNSGGAATAAKLVAARELSIPVLLWNRPPLERGDKFESVGALLEACQRYF